MSNKYVNDCKFNFDMFIKTLDLNIKDKGLIYFQIGDDEEEGVQKTIRYSNRRQSRGIIINHYFTLEIVIPYDTRKKRFIDSKIIVHLMMKRIKGSPDQVKRIGRFPLNLTKILNNQMTSAHLEDKLFRCNDTKARVKYHIGMELLDSENSPLNEEFKKKFEKKTSPYIEFMNAPVYFQTAVRSRSRCRSRRGSPRMKKDSRYSSPTYNFRYKSKTRSRVTTNDSPKTNETENLKKSYGFDICPRVSENAASSKKKAQYVSQAKSYHESIQSNLEVVQTPLIRTPLNQSYQSANLLGVRTRPNYTFDNEYDIEVSSEIDSSQKIAFGLIEENKELLRVNDGLKDEINVLRRMNVDLEKQNRDLREVVQSVNGDSDKKSPTRNGSGVDVRKFDIQRVEKGIKVVQSEGQRHSEPRKHSQQLVESELVQDGGVGEAEAFDKSEQADMLGNKDTQDSETGEVEKELRSRIEGYETMKLEFEKRVQELEEEQIENSKTIERLMKENSSMEETYEKRIKGLWDEIEEKNELIISLNERIEDSKSGKTLQERVQDFEHTVENIVKKSSEPQSPSNSLNNQIEEKKLLIKKLNGKLDLKDQLIEEKEHEINIQKEAILKLEETIAALRDSESQTKILLRKKSRELSESSPKPSKRLAQLKQELTLNQAKLQKTELDLVEAETSLNKIKFELGHAKELKELTEKKLVKKERQMDAIMQDLVIYKQDACSMLNILVGMNDSKVMSKVERSLVNKRMLDI